LEQSEYKPMGFLLMGLLFIMEL